MVVYVAGFPAIYGKQPLFFQDEIFRFVPQYLSQNYRPYSRRSCCE
nr:IncP-type DNA transfer coupling protein TraG [Salmonella enterica subsp. enterica serovar Rissen]